MSTDPEREAPRPGEVFADRAEMEASTLAAAVSRAREEALAQLCEPAVIRAVADALAPFIDDSMGFASERTMRDRQRRAARAAINVVRTRALIPAGAPDEH